MGIEPVTLQGSIVRLEPMTADHVDALPWLGWSLRCTEPEVPRRYDWVRSRKASSASTSLLTVAECGTPSTSPSSTLSGQG